MITICNSLPSILKCQNRQHFLILHRVIYGLSNTSGLNGASSCLPQSTCMQVDERDQFNCTGSNICVFYPIDRSLSGCKNIESNLTQIHITCVSLIHFKRYFTQLNKKFDFIPNKTNEIFDYVNSTSRIQSQNWLTTVNRIANKLNATNPIPNTNVLLSGMFFVKFNFFHHFFG